MISEFRNDDTGEFQCWDTEHTFKVLRCLRQGSVRDDLSIKDHPLIGAKFLRRKCAQILTIESVHKHWLAGFYEYAVFRIGNSRSHGTAFIRNINSIDAIVLKSIDEWGQEVEQIEKDV